ncbi:taurine transporter ATP-binding subunit [Devosia epidermidihirudinis]|uniref:Taurine transporter ATP-binding subunit n=1 Tax=Devosia epidermidihirudinis TaxID=1293439 RepID=A0A0F5QJW4_9HYPH|nr:ATP-binding cassette domain-containing protein [Devosia epidermidihirudinis]KKC40988.1 taurine transporter ATP-binding subunit [Devosia epidermidihirudinis]
MSELRLHAVSLTYASPRSDTPSVLERLTLGISRGEFVVVLGQSGSGKTSLLNVAAGFLEPTDGRVTVDGQAVHGPSAVRAVVFQDDALFPWLSARDNVAFPLRLRGVTRDERARRADALLADVGLEGQGDKPIWALSGGMRQRVGIARALASDPEFLLMDEPLGALDAMTRDQMQELLLAVWSRSNTGALLITHSVEEALFLATRVVVLAAHPGRIALSQEFDFGRRFLAGEAARALKSEPGFVAAREELIASIHQPYFEVAA